MSGSVTGACANMPETTDEAADQGGVLGLLADGEEVAGVGGFEWDIDTDTLTWSPELRRVYGVTDDEFGGNLAAFLTRVHPEDVDRVVADVSRAVARMGTFEFEERIIRGDGLVRTLATRGETLASADGRPLRVVGICRDVTDLRAWDDAMTWMHERFRRLVENSSDIVAVVTESGHLTYVAGPTERVLGYTPEELAHDRALRLVHPDDVELVVAAIAEVMERADGERTIELRVRHRDGRWRWFESVVTNHLDEPTLRGIVVNSRDVTARRAAEEAVAHGQLHDPLTGLPNRRLLLDRVAQALARRGRRGVGIAVLLVDLERFGWVNDTAGREAGDRVLVEAAARLRSGVRVGETVARVGADEFVVVCEDIGTPDEAVRTAGRLTQRLGAPLRVAGTFVDVRARVGVAWARADDEVDAESLLRDAAAAVRHAKEAGEHRIQLFTGMIRTRALQRAHLENDVRHAVEQGHLTVHYQPIVRLTDERTVGFEALLRWSGASPAVPAARIVAAAEANGLVARIGAEVLRRSCAQLATWDRAIPGVAPLCMTVNLSPLQLLDPRTVGVVGRSLEASGIDPSSLCLEITETALVGEAESAGEVVRGLKKLGVRIAIDDFGTGYSTLAYLKRFPADVLKIDRSFVSGVGPGSVDHTIVACVVQLAGALGAQVVAEGVEEPEQREHLVELGCGFAQGFLWSPAMAADCATRWLVAEAIR